MGIHFQKMHGAGNDFMLLDLREQDFDINRQTAIDLADRHTGVGCDQVLVLTKASAPGHLANFAVWNADGSRAEQCGNGVRCIGLYLHERGETPNGPFTIGGPVAEIQIECLPDGSVRVDMGVPDFDPEAIGLAAQATETGYRIEAGGQRLHIGAVSMGNPHAVVQVADASDAPVARLGAEIARHPLFKNGCNVGFAQVVDPKTIRLRVFERGAAETLACGSGACAAAAVLRRAGVVNSRVLVVQKGGDLIIDWSGGHESLLMTGPASHVFEGILK